MKAKEKKTSRYATKDGYSYLTKRTLVSRAQSAGKKAAKTAMDIMGYVVTVQEGWVVRRYEDGNVERIQKLEPAN